MFMQRWVSLLPWLIGVPTVILMPTTKAMMDDESIEYWKKLDDFPGSFVHSNGEWVDSSSLVQPLEQHDVDDKEIQKIVDLLLAQGNMSSASLIPDTFASSSLPFERDFSWDDGTTFALHEVSEEREGNHLPVDAFNPTSEVAPMDLLNHHVSKRKDRDDATLEEESLTHAEDAWDHEIISRRRRQQKQAQEQQQQRHFVPNMAQAAELTPGAFPPGRYLVKSGQIFRVSASNIPCTTSLEVPCTLPADASPDILHNQANAAWESNMHFSTLRNRLQDQLRQAPFTLTVPQPKPHVPSTAFTSEEWMALLEGGQRRLLESNATQTTKTKTTKTKTTKTKTTKTKITKSTLPTKKRVTNKLSQSMRTIENWTGLPFSATQAIVPFLWLNRFHFFTRDNFTITFMIQWRNQSDEMAIRCQPTLLYHEAHAALLHPLPFTHEKVNVGMKYSFPFNREARYQNVFSSTLSPKMLSKKKAFFALVPPNAVVDEVCQYSISKLIKRKIARKR